MTSEQSKASADSKASDSSRDAASKRARGKGGASSGEGGSQVEPLDGMSIPGAPADDVDQWDDAGSGGDPESWSDEP